MGPKNDQFKELYVGTKINLDSTKIVNTSKYVSIFETMYTKINDLNNWGLEFTKRLIRNKGNIFWNDVLNSWIEICNNEQTVEILIRQRALLHLIWVQTVCLCPPPPK